MNLYGFSLGPSAKHQGALMQVLTREGHDVIDKQNDPAAQAAGVDFMLNGQPCEFKHDDKMARSGNVVFELVSNVGKGTPGCLVTSRARWLWYYDTVNRIAYQIGLPELRKAIEKDSRNRYQAFKTTTKTTTKTTNDGFYATIGLLLEIGFLRAAKVIVREMPIDPLPQVKQ